VLRIRLISDHSLIPAFVKPGGVVLDLGTNQGHFALAMRDQFECTVIGYEPVPELHCVLPQDNRLTVHQMAVGGEQGRMDLHIYADRCASLAAGVSEALQTTMNVQVVTLADALQEVKTRTIAVLKVDIEGAELAMFDAAPDELLQRIEQITVEFHDWLFPGTSAHVNQVKSRLRALGFRELRMSLTNGDVLFVNRNLLPFSGIDYLWARFGQRYLLGSARMLRRVRARLRP
jgi:FkbM family methyltransferase